jgi:AraC-like DNA-binding protein
LVQDLKFSLSIFLLLFLGVILYRLMHAITPRNKMHLSYFLGHVALTFLICFLGFLFFLKLYPFPVEIIFLYKQLSLIFLFLFSKSIFSQIRPKVPKVIILVFLISLALFVFNFMGYRILLPVTLGINPGFNAGTLTILYRDTALFSWIANLLLVVLLIFNFVIALKRFKKQTKQVKAFVMYFSFYVSIILINLTIALILQFFFRNHSSAKEFTTLFRLFLIFEFLFPLIIPSFLSSIANVNFTKQDDSNLAHENQAFDHLTHVVMVNKLFLEYDFSLAKMQFHSNLSAKTIRNALKKSDFENFKSFLKHQRVMYAKDLINGGYLNKHTINSLSIDSGFSSPVTFFRAFKNITNQTPLSYSRQNNLLPNL